MRDGSEKRSCAAWTRPCPGACPPRCGAPAAARAASATISVAMPSARAWKPGSRPRRSPRQHRPEPPSAPGRGSPKCRPRARHSSRNRGGPPVLQGSDDLRVVDGMRVGVTDQRRAHRSVSAADDKTARTDGSRSVTSMLLNVALFATHSTRPTSLERPTALDAVLVGG